jgi:tetratricopeptide (TPR) repeat protein
VVTAQLSDELHARITELSEAGNVMADDGDLAGAEQTWLDAVPLLPEPATEWEAYTWLWASIGDVRYDQGDVAGAADAFFNALNGAGGIENPWVHFMLGKSLLKTDRRPRAIDELLRAYMLDDELFETDDEGEELLQAMRDFGVRDI